MNKPAIQSKELEDRLLNLSVSVIKTIRNDKQIPQSVKTQLTRSITSIGANYMEANNAASSADFRNKIFIAKKETAESIYWLKIIKELSEQPKRYDNIYDELDQLIKIFQKIISTLNSRRSSNEK